MRVKFPAFGLCEDSWKADAFATLYYSQWGERPRAAASSNSNGIKQESDSSEALSLKPSKKANKRRPSTAALPSDLAHKGKRPKAGSVSGAHPPVMRANSPSLYDIEIVRALPSNPAPAPLAPPATNPLPSPLAPITGTCDVLSATPMLGPVATTAPSASRPAAASVQRLLADAFDAQKIAPMQSSTDGPQENNASNNGSTDVTVPAAAQISKRKRKEPDMNSVVRPSAASTTPRNLCLIDWCKVNKGGLLGQFNAYWTELENIKGPIYEQYSQRSAMVKAMKKQVATPAGRPSAPEGETGED
ncbi:hypothetical protein HYDPIDRAFT_120394 [Hydnomerulius pinastri MD-312]|uniref:Uncharacterized protein n=1 Tax=Hydnomerulius pinastri MD-312 TaxID=994086 RepID=A0A0C9VJV3_9AGAM|nr:hypothetical protein HYDPIDRAFT_120394 [Hydnomerulius pinastri MD-312]